MNWDMEDDGEDWLIQDSTSAEFYEELNEEPIPANECIRRLNNQLTPQQKNELTRRGTITPANFSKWVRREVIPHCYIVGSTKKFYSWVDVARAMGVMTVHEREAKLGDGTGLIDRGAEVTISHQGSTVNIPKTTFELYQDRLTDELSECITPTERMNVTDKFWGSMFKEFKLKVQMGEFIEVYKVTEVLDMVLPNTRESLYKIAPTIAQKYPTADKDMIADIHETVSKALNEIQDVLTRNPNTQASTFIDADVDNDDQIKGEDNV